MAAVMTMAFATANAQALEPRLESHVQYLCGSRLGGRLAGSSGEKAAAEYLYGQLQACGVEMLTGREGSTFSVVEGGDTISSRNIIGMIEGFDPALRDEYIVVGAHYDHLGSYTMNVDGRSVSQAMPGADANASGVATMIEVARMIAERSLMLRRSIVFVGFGAGEKEFAGSRYFASGDGFPSVGKVRLMINLDCLGRGDSRNPFQIYTSLSSSELRSLMNHVLENESVTVKPTLFSGTVFPSDMISFSKAGIPSMMFSTGLSREYHTAKDAPDLVMYDNLAAEAIYIAAFIRSASAKEEIPGKIASAQDPDPKGSRIYSAAECDTRPQFFRNSEKHFLDAWVYKYLRYPRDAVANGIQGRLVVSFIIEKDGSVSNVAVDKPLYDSLDDEAIRVVKASPKWTPGTVGGRKVRTRISIPIEFRLTKE